MLKKILPVGIGIVLILAIALTVVLIKKANNRTPGIDDPDKIYVTYNSENGKYEITADRLYTYMKNKYGTNELLDWVDQQLYPEYSTVDTSTEDYMKFVKNEIFETEDLSNPTADEAESYQDTWDDIISSLRISNLLSASDAADKDYKNESSKVWSVVKDYYRLSYARTEAAKKAIWADFLEARGTTEADPFKNYYLKTSDETSSIEAYYEDNYSETAVVIAVAFNSEQAALNALSEVGVNIDSNVLSSNNGWIKDTYDYYSQAEVTDADKLSYAEVLKAFMNLNNNYNMNKKVELIDSAFEDVYMEKQTAFLVNSAIQSAFSKDGVKYGVKVALPTTVTINGKEAAAVAWSMTDSTYAQLNAEANEVSSNFENGDSVNDTTKSVKITLNYTITVGEETKTDKVTITLYGELLDQATVYTTPATYVESVSADAVEPYIVQKFTADFLANNEGFAFDKEAADKINEAFTSQIIGEDATLTIETDPSKAYKAYTVEPVEIGDYYFLIFLTDVQAAKELFSGETSTQTNSDGDVVSETYTIANQDLFDEIVAAMKAEIVNDENDINKFCYTNRYEHGLTIYDAYCEAIYQYNYNYFFETTIAANDYDEMKNSKKTQKSTIVSIQTEAGNKKSAVKLTAQELFNKLEAKYATNSVAVLVQNFLLVSDKELNKVYNPYTGEVMDKESYNNLIQSEVKSLKQNFENDYFTYSYLSYYGFTPNFPAKYGWSKFIKDYFVAYNDQELLTVATYGGSIYSEALTKYIDNNTLAEIKAEMQDNYNDYYNVNVYNILVTIDTDLNADADNSSNSTNLQAETDNWTAEQIDAAAKLVDLMLMLRPQSTGTTWINQMNEVVSLYKEALPNGGNISTILDKVENGQLGINDAEVFGPFVQLGLHVKVESNNNYTSETADNTAEAFVEKCREMYHEVEAQGLLDKDFDSYMFSDSFKTDFGYHVIALTKATSKVDLPSDEEIEIYRAQANVNTIQDTIDSTNESIASYKESGYNTASYEAQLAYAEKKLADYQAVLDAVLAKYGKEADYELDEDATERLTTWYDDAEDTIEGGTIVTEKFTNLMKSQISSFTFNGNISADTFNDYLTLVLEQCAEENN